MGRGDRRLMGVELKDAVSGALEAPVSPTKAEALKLEGKAPLLVGETYPVGSRLLLKEQALPAQNGIFKLERNEAIGGEGTIAGSGKIGVGEKWVLVRTEDADSVEEVHKGMMVLSRENGQTNGSWVLTSNDPIEPGVTAQEFAELAPVTPPENEGTVKIRWAGGVQFSEGKVVEHGLGVAPRSVTLTAETVPGTLVEVNLAENPNMDAKQFTIIGYAALLAPAKGTECTVQWIAKA